MIFNSVLVFIIWFAVLMASIYGINFRNRCKKDLTGDSILQQYSYLTATLTGALLFTGYALVQKYDPPFEANYIVLCATIISIAVTGITINFIKKCKQSEITTNSMWIPGMTLTGAVLIFIITVYNQVKTKNPVI